MEWHYLYSAEWQVRHTIARWAIETRCDMGVEVGAFHVPVLDTGFAIDPLVTVPAHPGVFHGTVAQWLGSDDCERVMDAHSRGASLGVVALGLDIEGGDAEWTAFLHLCDEADRIVLEWAVDHGPSVEQAVEVLARRAAGERRVATAIELHLPDPGLPGFPAFCRRQLVIVD